MDRGRRRRSITQRRHWCWHLALLADHGDAIKGPPPRLTMTRRSCRKAMRQSPSYSSSSPATHAIARPNSRVTIRLSVLERRARCLGAYRAPGLATVRQPPLADAMEVAFVSGRSEAKPGVWRAQVNVLAVL